MTTPRTGQELIDSEEEVNGYRFEKIFGRDTAGRLIFRAINYKRQRRAVKIISLIPAQILDTAIDETIRMTDLNHPNIADVYEFMVRKQNTELLIFTQYYEDNMARAFKALPDGELVKCAIGIIEAVVYLHDHANMSHGDLRLESVQLDKNRVPKLSFYSLDWQYEVPRDCYLTRELIKQLDERGRISQLETTKVDDLWALGILLLQLFSKKRIIEILGLDIRNGHEACKQVYYNNKMIFQSLKFSKIRELVRKLVNPNYQERPSARQFLKDFQSAVEAPDFSIIKQTRQPPPNREERNIMKSMSKSPALKKKPTEQKYEQIIQRTSRKTNSDAFRLDDVKDRLKLKILNLSDMKITRIEPIHNLPNLQWLYLQNNQIRKIQNLDYARLKGLHLASNLISKIEGLDRLTSLEELYLEHNQITKIENLEQLRNLKWLYLSSNKIQIVENLQQLIALKTVVLRQNKIDEFQKENVEAIRSLRKEHIQVILQ